MKNLKNSLILKISVFMFLCIFLAGSFMLYGCSLVLPKKESAQPVQISAEKVAEILKTQKDKYVILDVRTKEEFDSGHLGSAILIPVDELETRLGELPKNKPIIVYCRSGSRSAKAAGILAANNFSPVYDMTGGINAWTAAGYPVVVENSSNAGQDTNNQSGESGDTSSASGATTDATVTEAANGETSQDLSGSTLVDYLTADELYNKINQGEDMVILDVRSSDSFSVKHIKGAINIPYTELAERAAELDKSKLIVAYCSDVNCGLSKNAYDILIAAGLTNVLTLQGGIESWQAKGYPVE